jgi:glycine/serine hydroxymethyltransferase
MTSRGFKEEDVRRTVEAISLVLNHPDDEKAIEEAGGIVNELTEANPLYV